MDKLTQKWEVAAKESWEIDLEQLEKDDKLRNWSVQEMRKWIREKVALIFKK